MMKTLELLRRAGADRQVTTASAKLVRQYNLGVGELDKVAGGVDWQPPIGRN